MMFLRAMPIIFITIFLIFLTGCFEKESKLSNGPAAEIIKENPPPSQPTPTEPPIDNPNSGFDPNLGICSKLDLSEVVWPGELTVAEWTYYALALNITGSYEGREGWQNIAGNFDGQGLSLGLMQQNLGQGTLQPGLIEMYQYHNAVMTNLFTSSDYRSLKSMLEAWQKSPLSLSSVDNDILFPTGPSTNKLDIDFERDLDSQGAAENAKSVTWAKQTILDSSGKLITRWKKSFQDMAVTPGYRSFQLSASTTLFHKAQQYFEYFNFRELRFLLFLFDIVVQNGSIKEEHLVKYNMWLANHPGASEQERALALLEARLTTVKPQYVADVRARKSTIIHGTGTVHQTPRNFPVEYCFDPRVIVQ